MVFWENAQVVLASYWRFIRGSFKFNRPLNRYVALYRATLHTEACHTWVGLYFACLRSQVALFAHSMVSTAAPIFRVPSRPWKKLFAAAAGFKFQNAQP